jgi:hypothetical protein
MRRFPFLGKSGPVHTETHNMYSKDSNMGIESSVSLNHTRQLARVFRVDPNPSDLCTIGNRSPSTTGGLHSGYRPTGPAHFSSEAWRTRQDCVCSDYSDGLPIFFVYKRALRAL